MGLELGLWLELGLELWLRLEIGLRVGFYFVLGMRAWRKTLMVGKTRKTYQRQERICNYLSLS
jgi:hypothetical protein